MLHNPSLEELPQLVQSWRPTMVYVSGGVPGPKEELHTQALAPLRFLQSTEGGCCTATGCLGRPVSLLQALSRGRWQEAWAGCSLHMCGLHPTSMRSRPCSRRPSGVGSGDFFVRLQRAAT